MGQAYLERGNTQEAIDTLEVACRISSNDELPHFQLAKTYYAMNELEFCWKKLVDATDRYNHTVLSILFL